MQSAGVNIGTWWRRHETAKVQHAQRMVERGRSRYMLSAFPLYTLPCLLPAVFFALRGDIEHDSMMVYCGSMMIVAALTSFVVCRMHWRQYEKLAAAASATS